MLTVIIVVHETQRKTLNFTIRYCTCMTKDLRSFLQISSTELSINETSPINVAMYTILNQMSKHQQAH